MCQGTAPAHFDVLERTPGGATCRRNPPRQVGAEKGGGLLKGIRASKEPQSCSCPALSAAVASTPRTGRNGMPALH
jgi:hypothetical protein